MDWEDKDNYLDTIALQLFSDTDESQTLATMGIGWGHAEANAERLVKAVNSYDAMYEALKGLLWITAVVYPTKKLSEYRAAASQALALAEGK